VPIVPHPFSQVLFHGYQEFPIGPGQRSDTDFLFRFYLRSSSSIAGTSFWSLPNQQLCVLGAWLSAMALFPEGSKEICPWKKDSGMLLPLHKSGLKSMASLLSGALFLSRWAAGLFKCQVFKLVAGMQGHVGSKAACMHDLFRANFPASVFLHSCILVIAVVASKYLPR